MKEHKEPFKQTLLSKVREARNCERKEESSIHGQGPDTGKRQSPVLPSSDVGADGDWETCQEFGGLSLAASHEKAGPPCVPYASDNPRAKEGAPRQALILLHDGGNDGASGGICNNTRRSAEVGVANLHEQR